MLNGEETAEIPVDFTILTELDDSGVSRYVVGGRVYFEGSVFGNGVNSFTYKGFFDDANYEEPSSTLKKIKSSGLVWIISGGVVVLLLLVLVIYCCCKKSDDVNKTGKKKSD